MLMHSMLPYEYSRHDSLHIFDFKRHVCPMISYGPSEAMHFKCPPMELETCLAMSD